MGTSELFTDLTLLAAIATVIVLAAYYVRLKVKSLFRGFRKLKLEQDLAKMSKRSRTARWMHQWLTNPRPPSRKVGMVDEFMMACETGDLKTVRHLMNKGVHVNARRAKEGRTGLMLASQNRHFEVVNYLLQTGSDVNAAGGRSGKTALIRASEAGHVEIVEALIKAGAKINATSTVSAKTALMGAVQYGNLDAAMLLLKEGADVNARNKDGDTALDFALNDGLYDLVVLLKAYGAEFDEYNERERSQSEPMDIDSLYAVLNCKKTDSIEQVRTQYRTLIKQYHPDVIQGKGLPADFVEFANKKFQQIQHAYDYISKRTSS